MKQQNSMNLIKAEAGDYENYPIPNFYEFDSQDAKERVLYANFERINAEVKEMVDHIQKEVVKK